MKGYEHKIIIKKFGLICGQVYYLMSTEFERFYSNFVAFSEYMNIIVFLHVSKLWCQVPVCELFLIALKFEDMTSTCKKHSTHTFTAEIMRPDCVLNLLSNIEEPSLKVIFLT